MSYFADCLTIAKAARNDRELTIQVGLLVLLSIRQPFYTVGEQLESVRYDGTSSKYLWGFKCQGYRDLRDKAAYIMDCVNEYETTFKQTRDHRRLVYQIMNAVHGMGIVKASFYAQMLTGDGACMDQHNVAHLGLPERCFRADRKDGPAMCKRLQWYDDTWRAEGNSAYWWNRWCDYVATLYPEKFANGEAVSKMHLRAIDFSLDPTYIPTTYNPALDAFNA